MTTEDLTGENRCWPCTVANSAVGLAVALVPLAAALVTGDPVTVTVAAAWAVAVVGVTAYRLVSRGYLPLAEPVAKLTGLHERIGPGEDRDGVDRDEQ